MQFRFTWIVAGSLIVLATLIALLRYGGPAKVELGSDTLHLYCAAGVRKPVQEIIQQYEQRYGVKVETNYDGSGKLLGEIRAGDHGDLYLAADFAYIQDAQQLGLVEEHVDIAQQRPCIVVRRGGQLAKTGRTFTRLEDLLDPAVKVSLAEPKVAAISRSARRQLEGMQYQGQPLWDALFKKATVTRQTVNEVANDIDSDVVDAGIVWDATASQYERLQVVRVPQFEAAQERISACVLHSSRQPTRALHFLRFMAARDQGLLVFQRYGYQTVPGDQWAETPELHLFTGGLMHPAIQETIREFEQREGVHVVQTPNGCGILVSQIKAGEHPDLYFACDTTFMTRVQDVFPRWQDLSETEMVMVVAPDKQAQANVRTLQEFVAQPWKFGLCDPQHSALGDLSQRLLQEAGLWDQVRAKVVDWPSTADRLVESVVIGGIDAAIVYRANTVRQADKLVVLPIESPHARAVQPIAVATDSPYPQLTQRLIDRLRSSGSRQRFEALGFHWLGDSTP
jgi:molybdenum ABC transporter molybdate-binding protein